MQTASEDALYSITFTPSSGRSSVVGNEWEEEGENEEEWEDEEEEEIIDQGIPPRRRRRGTAEDNDCDFDLVYC